MRRRTFIATALAAGAFHGMGGAAVATEDTRTFAAPAARVWVVTASTLRSLGWKIDKEDRAVGWITTKSRPIAHGEYGVYAKGTKHALRLLVKGRDGGRTEVTVERRVFKEERILWMDKEEDLKSADRIVEKQVLDAIAKAL